MFMPVFLSSCCTRQVSRREPGDPLLTLYHGAILSLQQYDSSAHMLKYCGPSPDLLVWLAAGARQRGTECT